MNLSHNDVVVPSLTVIKPGRKKALTGPFSESFDKCILSDNSEENSTPTMSITHVKVDNVKVGRLNTAGCGVYYADNVLSSEECSAFRKCIDSCKDLTFWSQSKDESCSSDLNDLKMFRDADTVEVKSTYIADCIWRRIKNAFLISSEEDIPRRAEAIVNNIVVDLSNPEHNERDLTGLWLPVGLNHDLLFAKYSPNGCFAPHTDGRTVHDFNTRSFYSVIIFLSDIPISSGGGTRFYTDDTINSLICDDNHWTAAADKAVAEVESVAGRFLLFHQSLVHEGVPTDSSTSFCKYIIRSDIMYGRSPAVCDGEQDRAAFALFQQAEDLAELGDVSESIKHFQRAFKLSPEMARMMGHG